MQKHVLAAILLVIVNVRSVLTSNVKNSSKVSTEHPPRSHLAVTTNATLFHAFFGQQVETNVRDNVDEERVINSWVSKVSDTVGQWAMKLNLNPRLVFMLSRAGKDLKGKRFVRWLQYVFEYRDRKRSLTHFTNDAIYKLVKKKKTDAELLTVFQSIRQRTDLPAVKQLAEGMSVHTVEYLLKADWLTNGKHPKEVFRILDLGKKDDLDNPLFYEWLKYVGSYNSMNRDGGTKPAMYTDRALYDLLKLTKSNADLTALFDSLQYIPDFERLATSMLTFLAANSASRRKMFEAWLESTSDPKQVFYNLRLDDKSNFNELTEWFRYVDFYWRGPEGVARQNIFDYNDCIALLRSTYSDGDLNTVFYSLRRDPSIKDFVNFMLMQPQLLEQTDLWLASNVSPSSVFKLLKLGSELDPYNYKLNQFLVYVNKYKSSKGEITTKELYFLLRGSKKPQDLAIRLESLRQLPDIEPLVKTIQVYMVTNRATKQQMYEAWLGSSTDPTQVFTILCKDEQNRGSNLYSEWLQYVKFYWSGPEGVARHSDFNYDDTIGMLRTISKSDDDVEVMINSVRGESKMKEFADDMVTYLKIVQHKTDWLKSDISPVEAYKLLNLGVEKDPNNLRLRQWLSYVYTYRILGRNGATRNSFTDQVLFDMLKRLHKPAKLIDVVASLRKVPYMAKIAKSMETHINSDSSFGTISSSKLKATWRAN